MPAKKIKKILVIRFSSFGDVVLATAFVEVLQKKYPEAQIYFLTKPAFAEVFFNNPHVKLCIDLKNFDLVYDLSVNLRSFFVTLFMKAKIIRVPKNSFSRRLMVWFKKFPAENISILAKYSQFLGFSDEIVRPKIYLNQQKMVTDKIYVGINPSAKWQNKRWILEKYAAVIDELLAQKIFVVLFGDESDFLYNRQIVAKLKNDQKYLLDLTGKLNKLELFKAVQNLNLLVTTDSALLHIAQAFEISVIVLFGPTVREFGFWQPNKNDVLLEVNLPCRPCHLHGGNVCPKRHFRCMREISVEMVMQEIRKKLCKFSVE